jgi:hypothetical protein
MQVVEVKPCRQGKGPRILAFSAFPFIAPPLPLEKSRSNRTGSMQRALSVFGLFTRSLTG